MLAAMVAGRLRLPAIVGCLTGALFVVYVVGLAPHLVHHLFDPHQTQADCPFATAAEREHAMPVAVVTVVTPVTAVSLPPPPTLDLPVTVPAVASARAPPVIAS
ncbi:MAG: hypothetical protein AUH29_01940 [Candidatus Rokubacteria bacterium 13_1_40CM_69_27]|nr:MAG: hypothetical protein AUH29_01940 [Candidatus Rokubacteria bacterium 13_1_40CM_69_27]